MRSLSVVVICSIVAGSTVLTIRTYTDDRPILAPGPPEEVSDEAFGLDRARELDAIQQRLLWQIEQADLIADDLITGDLTLGAAADRLEEVNQSRIESLLVGLRHNHNRPTAGPQELFARYALGKVRNRLKTDPATLAEVAPRLNAEFRVLVPTNECPLDEWDRIW